MRDKSLQSYTILILILVQILTGQCAIAPSPSIYSEPPINKLTQAPVSTITTSTKMPTTTSTPTSIKAPEVKAPIVTVPKVDLTKINSR
jgi:hypothetical protein